MGGIEDKHRAKGEVVLGFNPDLEVGSQSGPFPAMLYERTELRFSL